MDRRALWVWWRMVDFARDQILPADRKQLLNEMPPQMRESVMELIPKVIAWLSRMIE
jgi:hypothetical protein